MSSPLNRLFVLKPARTLRVSSYDRSGGNADSIRIPAGQTAVLADIKGAGVIRHIWFTIAAPDPLFRRHAVLRMFWDGEERPSVESPLGDFFGQGWGEKYNFVSLPLAAAPREGNALVCYFPMPFARSARIEVENQSEQDVHAFYYYIDYELFPREAELLAAHGTSGRLAYFHAWWNREITGPDQEAGGRENEWAVLGPFTPHPTDAGNYLLIDAEGEGHVVGVNYYVDCPTPIWYGEGDDMWLIDGEQWPGSLHGTGTEDFFNCSWSPNETYLHPYFGYARVPRQNTGWLGRTHAYRFFLEDPIRFKRSIKGSIEHGHANVLTLDLSSVVYWYQTEPHKPFPPLPPAKQRENMPEIGAVEIHRWRHAWRETLLKARQGKEVPVLWGNEPLP